MQQYEDHCKPMSDFDSYMLSDKPVPPGFEGTGPLAKSKPKLSPVTIALICIIGALVLFTVIYFPVMYAPRKKTVTVTGSSTLAGINTAAGHGQDALAGSGVYMQKYRRAIPARINTNTSLLGLGSVKSPDELKGPLADSADTMTLRRPLGGESPAAGGNIMVPPAPSGNEDTEPFVNVDMALMLFYGDEEAIIIVVSPGCGACHRLRETLKRLRSNGGKHKHKNLGLLDAGSWKEVRDKFNFDLNSVPTLFKVSGGRVRDHRIGNMPVSDLDEFVTKR
jgi:hypothetical protein